MNITIPYFAECQTESFCDCSRVDIDKGDRCNCYKECGDGGVVLDSNGPQCAEEGPSGRNLRR